MIWTNMRSLLLAKELFENSIIGFTRLWKCTYFLSASSGSGFKIQNLMFRSQTTSARVRYSAILLSRHVYCVSDISEVRSQRFLALPCLPTPMHQTPRALKIAQRLRNCFNLLHGLLEASYSLLLYPSWLAICHKTEQWKTLFWINSLRFSHVHHVLHLLCIQGETLQMYVCGQWETGEGFFVKFNDTTWKGYATTAFVYRDVSSLWTFTWTIHTKKRIFPTRASFQNSLQFLDLFTWFLTLL